MMDKRALQWACRRGMLELDIILELFLKRCQHLSSQEQACFFRLLNCSDQQLFDWLVIKGEAPCEFQGILKKIHCYV